MIQHKSILQARKRFHGVLESKSLLCWISYKEKATGHAWLAPTNADTTSSSSVRIACGIARRLGITTVIQQRLHRNTIGKVFQEVCVEYLKETFLGLEHLRPGNWAISIANNQFGSIDKFDQYEHLGDIAGAANQAKALAQGLQGQQSQDIAALLSAIQELASTLGSDYLITPDVIVARRPEDDGAINSRGVIVDGSQPSLTPLRRANTETPTLHASVSCKWTIRSDRAQNARSEGLNLTKNRKGKLPHVVVVTGEPSPTRLASIALGTGEIDCTYHIALPELQEAVVALSDESAMETLKMLVDGKRLRDISDLPLDLAI